MDEFPWNLTANVSETVQPERLALANAEAPPSGCVEQVPIGAAPPREEANGLDDIDEAMHSRYISHCNSVH